MKARLALFLLNFLSTVFAFGGSASATTVVGTSTEDNCIPFVCGYFGVTEYQQVYSSAAFSGSMSINDIIFYDTNQYSVGDPTLAGGTFTFALSYTTKSVNGLSTNLASNIGTGSSTVFTGYLPTFASHELLIALSTSFVYDPSLGNLLLTVTISGPSGNSSPNLDSDGSGTLTSRAFSAYNFGPAEADAGGLVTGFDGSPLSTPLPATLPLFATGLGALGLLGWRRKRKAEALAA